MYNSPGPNWLQRLARGLLRLWGRVPAGRVRHLTEWSYTPKFMIDAVAVVFDADARLLLVRHTYKPRAPWGLPGGGLHYGETPEAAVQRELWEEAGVVAAVGRLLGTRTDTDRRLIKLCYLCHARRQQFRPNAEIAAFGYFLPAALPPGTAPLVAGVLAMVTPADVLAARRPSKEP